MGAQSNGAALTETRGDPAAAGTHLFVGVDIGRFYHLVAAIPQVEDGERQLGACCGPALRHQR